MYFFYISTEKFFLGSPFGKIIDCSLVDHVEVEFRVPEGESVLGCFHKRAQLFFAFS